MIALLLLKFDSPTASMGLVCWTLHRSSDSNPQTVIKTKVIKPLQQFFFSNGFWLMRPFTSYDDLVESVIGSGQIDLCCGQID